TGFDIINTISGVYLAGSFTGSFTLGSTTMTSAGGKDGLLFQFNDQTLAPASNLFNDKIGGTGDDEILTIYHDSTGTSTFIIKIGGYFSGTANFQIGSGGASNLTSSGGRDGFTVGYTYISSTSGGILTDEFIKHGGTGDDEIVDISMNNNISTRYHFVGNTSLTSGGSLVNLGSIQNYVVTAYTGNFTPADATKITKASALAFTIDNVFYTGEFNATTDFNITSTASNLTFTSGGSNMFLQKSNTCVNSATTPLSISGPASICVGNSVTMFVGENDTANNINSNLNWKWYSGSCGGTLVGTGSTITVSPTNTTTYYVRGEGGCVPDGGCIATGKTVTVYAIPNDNVTLSGNTLTSSQVGNNATYQWVNCATNTDISGAVGVSYTPTSNGSYAVKVSNPGGCLVTSACTNVTLCNPASTPTISGNNSVCSGQSVTLSIATGSLNGSTSWKWYSG
ncbi:MAG: immunoglobulin domain-containing protein, partial [Microcoleaceae cyanobacterium]